MARKVFVSFLGTNRYIECYYIDGKYKSPVVRFVQEALIRNTCKKWQPTDKILVFCTEKAEQMNWLDNGQPRAVTDMQRQGLQSRLERLRNEEHILNAEVEMVRIKEGFTEEEVWSIFSTVYEHLQEGDEIYFDVTHALRSIPIFSVVLLNFAKFMKDTRIMSIKYGAFESLGIVSDVEKMPMEKRLAPVLDLMSIVRLQEYNQLASDLVYYGKVYEIGNAIYDDNDSMIRDLANSIADLEDNITSLKLPEIRGGRFVADFMDCMQASENLPRPIRQLLQRLKEEMSQFVPYDSFLNIEAAIEWANKYDMVMQEYALAVEYVKLFVSEQLYYDYDNRISEQLFSLIATSLIGMSDSKFNKRQWGNSLASVYAQADDDETDEIEIIANGLAGNPLIVSLRKRVSGIIPYRELNNRRNNFLHANGKYTYEQLSQDFYPLYEQCREILHRSRYWTQD